MSHNYRVEKRVSFLVSLFFALISGYRGFLCAQSPEDLKGRYNGVSFKSIYQIVYCACANSVDQVYGQVKQKHGNQKGHHIGGDNLVLGR